MESEEPAIVNEIADLMRDVVQKEEIEDGDSSVRDVLWILDVTSR